MPSDDDQKAANKNPFMTQYQLNCRVLFTTLLFIGLFVALFHQRRERRHRFRHLVADSRKRLSPAPNNDRASWPKPLTLIMFVIIGHFLGLLGRIY